MSKTIITLQSKDKRDLELFFDILDPSIAKGLKQWESDKVNETGDKHKVHTSIFSLDFKALRKYLKEKRVEVEVEVEVLKKKQDLSKNKALIEKIKEYREKGFSFSKIADEMNMEGLRNSRGNRFNKMTVSRLFKS